MDRVPQWLLAQMMSTTPASRPVTAETMADYYLFHPDGRIVASFFLGGAFMHALHYLFSSSWVRSLLQRLRTTLYAPLLSRRRRGVQVDPENPATLTLSEKGLGFIREKHQRNESEGDRVESQSVRQYNDHSSLVFVLNLCLLLASFALFLTLLAFRKGWETGCTFVVAWAGMSSQVARLLGMLILILELDALLKLKRWTVWALRVMLVVALVFIFAAQATNTGTTGTPRGAQAAFCYRQFFLATSLVSSIIRLLMEIYLLIRVIMLLWSHKRLFDDDIRVSRPLARVLSLFVFDMMTVVPDATPTTLPAQFIPFSVGAILVMVTFNWKKHTRKTDQTSRVQSLIVFSKPPATGDPLLVPTPFTLHFPREHRTSHSWRSDGGGPIPESSEEQDVLDITGPSRPLSAYSSDSSRRSSRSVDNAIITRGVPAYTGSPRTVALPPVTPPSTSYYPVSAPPQLSGFSGSGPTSDNQPPNPNVVRKILPSQVEYAAELEREQARLEEEIIRLAQPAVPPLPLDGPRGELIQRDADEITIYSQSQYRNSTNTYRPMITPASAFFSQDVQRNRSNRKTGRMNSTRSTVNPSPAPTQGSFAFSPYESVRSYFRESYDSRLTRASEDESQVSGASSNGSHGGSIKRKGGSGSASASGKRNTFLSPTDSLSSKLPWKSNNLSRFSLASMRSRSREELPTVREQSPESGERSRQRVFPMPRPTVVIGRVPSSSKRRTFGQAGTPTGSTGSGRRASNRPSILNLYGGRPISSLPPMPSTLPTPQRVTPFTPFTASSARRQSQSSSGHDHNHQEIPPVPQIQVRELPVPSLQVLPATPEPAYVPGNATPPPASTNADAPTPAWISRPIRSSIVRGPRPLPSAPIITPGMGRGAGSGWPTALQVSGGPPGISGPSLTEVSPASSYGGEGGQLDPRRIDGGSEGYLTRSSTRRTRSNSCPSMYSVDSPVEDGEDARSL